MNPRYWFLFLSTLLMVMLIVPAAQAAGGACPARANYGPSANQTLSSLGVTSCYYVASNGSDSNDGLSEASGHPWAHAPGMPNCSESCATVQNAFNGPPAGTGFIFRGGDSWHFGNSSASPSTGGTWVAGNDLNGTQSNPYYIGVDQSWYSGGSWARPIFTGDNPVCSSSTVGGNCNSGAYSSYHNPQYYVNSCAYQVGSTNDMINISGASHFIFDNLEITGLCSKQPGQPGGWDLYFGYGSSADVKFLNLYLHGWTHQQFVDVNGAGACNTGVCTNIELFAGGGHSTPDDVFRYVVVDGSDSDPYGALVCYCDFWDVAYSYFGNHGGVVDRYPHLYHDNLYEYWYEDGHGNVLESVGDPSGTNATYNSVFRHINVFNDPGDPLFWPAPPVGTLDYFFNLLLYDVGSMEYFNAGQNNSNEGAIVLFNNTFQTNVNTGISCSATGNSSSLTVANMHYIADFPPFLNPTGNCQPWIVSNVTNLSETNSAATSAGYTPSEAYAYSPAGSNSPTVGAGTNEGSVNGAFCSVLATAAGLDPTLSGAAAACQSDTTYACIYNTTNHTVTCPVRIPVARPTDGAWDIGAYQYCPPGQCTQAPPPTTTNTSSFSPQVYPNPWRSDKHSGYPVTFSGLAAGTDIKIFTVSGHKVAELYTDGPSIQWDLSNDSGDKVASGIYLYIITDSQGDKVRGKVAVIR